MLFEKFIEVAFLIYGENYKECLKNELGIGDEMFKRSKRCGTFQTDQEKALTKKLFERCHSLQAAVTLLNKHSRMHKIDEPIDLNVKPVANLKAKELLDLYDFNVPECDWKQWNTCSELFLKEGIEPKRNELNALGALLRSKGCYDKRSNGRRIFLMPPKK